MKKIKATINQKDRVVCVTIQGGHEIYYQPVCSKERILLFATKDFSGSAFAYFRDKGRNMNGRGFSLTIKELYELKGYYKNPKLTHIIERIPAMIEYVLLEHLESMEADKDNIVNRVQTARDTYLENSELAA